MMALVEPAASIAVGLLDVEPACLTGQRLPGHFDVDRAFFVPAAGTRLLYCTAHLAWLELVRRAGLQPRSANCRPGPHDLRHSFAVLTLLGWYRDGAGVQARMPLLSIYLGHVHPAMPTGISPPLTWQLAAVAHIGIALDANHRRWR
jgi:integrase